MTATLKYLPGGMVRIAYIDPMRDEVVWLEKPDNGTVPPPYIDFHEPFVGAHRFFYAECYGLKIPAKGKSR